jgi:hypothetical protein
LVGRYQAQLGGYLRRVLGEAAAAAALQDVLRQRTAGLAPGAAPTDSRGHDTQGN